MRGKLKDMKYNVLKKSCLINNEIINYNEYSLNVNLNNRDHTIIFKAYDKTGKELLSNNADTSDIILKPKVNSKNGVITNRAYAVLDFGLAKQEIELKMHPSDVFILELVFDSLNKKK